MSLNPLRALLSLLVAFPFTAVVILFAVSNRQQVEVGLYPLPFTVAMPLYLLVLGAALLALVGGALTAWLLGHRARVTARKNAKRLQSVEQELAHMRMQILSSASSDKPALLQIAKK